MKLKSRLHRLPQEGGFTLIEMLIVVAIVAILVAIAVPALNNAKSNAQITKENSLAAAIAIAKNRAVLQDEVTAGTDATFVGFSKYLLVDGVQPILTKLSLAVNNGTGKNVTSWGKYPVGNLPADVIVFGPGAAVTQ